MRQIRPLLAAVAAIVALSAPVASADPKQPTATGTGGAAASVDRLATQAAVDVMRRGGNAFDAAIAAAGVLGVVEPYSCGIGGGGFMVLRDGRTGSVTTLDSRETAPAAIQPDSFFIDGRPPDPSSSADFAINRYSGLSVGVPGTPALWEYVLNHFGTYSLRQALRYGARVARRGFTVDQTFYDQTLPNATHFDDIPSTAAIYLDPDGTPRDIGSTIRNPDLARTYARLGRLGVERGFYTGRLAREIVQTADHPPVAPSADHAYRPGLMTASDLASYHVIPRAPAHIAFQGLDVYGMGPPSSGGSTVEEALNILEAAHPQGTLQTLYDYLEASRLAYADRNAYVADPAFYPVPLHGLLSQAYADERAKLIPPESQNDVVDPGDPGPFNGTAQATITHPRESTTHLSVADRFGNVVAYTFTIEQTGGDGIVVPGRGFLLNNELTDFNTDSTTVPNRAQGGKRPRSSISPTILERDGRPVLTVGSPGGASIITTVLQILVNRLDLGYTLPQAIAAPRASQRNSTTSEVEQAFEDSAVGQQLASQYDEAYRLADANPTLDLPEDNQIGAATGIEFGRHDRFLAAAEPVRRGGGSAMVVSP
jgi:gamma-glutamyltranspeptidase/glutathione hydrolase